MELLYSLFSFTIFVANIAVAIFLIFDILKQERIPQNIKILWIILAIFVTFITLIVWFIWGRDADYGQYQKTENNSYPPNPLDSQPGFSDSESHNSYGFAPDNDGDNPYR